MRAVRNRIFSNIRAKRRQKKNKVMRNFMKREKDQEK